MFLQSKTDSNMCPKWLWLPWSLFFERKWKDQKFWKIPLSHPLSQFRFWQIAIMSTLSVVFQLLVLLTIRKREKHVTFCCRLGKSVTSHGCSKNSFNRSITVVIRSNVSSFFWTLACFLVRRNSRISNTFNRSVIFLAYN